MEFDPDKFADWMKETREKKGLSWYSMADLAGLHQSALATIEHHGRDVRMSTFIKICNALEQNPCSVLRRSLSGR